jgi:hypothetical protein
VVLDGDDRVAEMGGDPGERDVAPLLVHAEPGAAPRVQENRIADAAFQSVDRNGLPDRPEGGQSAAESADREHNKKDPPLKSPEKLHATLIPRVACFE